MTISASAARSAERRADRLLLYASAGDGLVAIGGETAGSLREGCLGFLCFLRGAGFSVTRGPAISTRSAQNDRFALADDALQAIETAPVQQPPSVETLATALGTTRRTLRNAFQETLGTSPSRYILARRLHGARRNLNCGESHLVTDAALDYGFEHFGRFAYHYRTLFGETPSTTLLRARVFRRDALR